MTQIIQNDPACKGIDTDPEARREFMLAVVRATRARIQTMMYELDEVGVSLKYKMISAEGAATWCNQIGALDFMPTEVNGGLITIDEVAA